jgi:hypothetical protein
MHFSPGIVLEQWDSLYAIGRPKFNSGGFANFVALHGVMNSVHADDMPSLSMLLQPSQPTKTRARDYAAD